MLFEGIMCKSSVVWIGPNGDPVLASFRTLLYAKEEPMLFRISHMLLASSVSSLTECVLGVFMSWVRILLAYNPGVIVWEPVEVGVHAAGFL